MKIALRIVSLLLSIWIVVFAFLPPTLFQRDGEKKKEEKPAKTEVAAKKPAKTPPKQAQSKAEEARNRDLNAGSQVIYDVLGGAQLETGQRAKDELNKIHELRQDRMGELGGYGKEKE